MAWAATSTCYEFLLNLQVANEIASIFIDRIYLCRIMGFSNLSFVNESRRINNLSWDSRGNFVSNASFCEYSLPILRHRYISRLHRILLKLINDINYIIRYRFWLRAENSSSSFSIANWPFLVWHNISINIYIYFKNVNKNDINPFGFCSMQ